MFFKVFYLKINKVTKSASNPTNESQLQATTTTTTQPSQNIVTNTQETTAMSTEANGAAVQKNQSALAQNKLYLQELNDLTSFHKVCELSVYFLYTEWLKGFKVS